MSHRDELQDRLDITDICVKYGIIIDSRDWARLRECFTDDAVADYLDMPSCQGLRAIEDTCRQALSPLTATQHLIANVLVTLRGDEAETICYLQAQHVRSGTPGGENFIIGGRYLDRFTRTPLGWRIKHRRLEGTWTEGNPAVVSPS